MIDMFDKFGHVISLNDVVMVYVPIYKNFLKGKVFDFSDNGTQRIRARVLVEKGQYGMKSDNSIYRFGDEVVVIGSNDPRVTRFLLEHSA